MPQWQGLLSPPYTPGSRKQSSGKKQGHSIKTFRPTSNDPLSPRRPHSKSWGPGVTHMTQWEHHPPTQDVEMRGSLALTAGPPSSVSTSIWGKCAFSGCPTIQIGFSTGSTLPDFYITPPSRLAIAYWLFCFCLR